MSVTSVITNILYTGDGLTTIYPIPFYFINQTDIVVQGVRIDGSLFTFELNSDYLISGVPNLIGDYESGANVVFNVPPPNGMQLLIQRITQRTQVVEFFNGGPITAETLEHIIDKLTLLMQEGFIQGYKGVALDPPTAGTALYQVGDWFKNANPLPGGVFGWVCVSAGSPGLWAAFGLISLLS